MADDEFGAGRASSQIDLEGAPSTRAILEAHRRCGRASRARSPRGWDDVVADAPRALVDLSSETGVEIRVAQIKSKFAGLLV